MAHRSEQNRALFKDLYSYDFSCLRNGNDSLAGLRGVKSFPLTIEVIDYLIYEIFSALLVLVPTSYASSSGKLSRENRLLLKEYFIPNLP